MKLSKYLFGRSKTKISWSLFNLFIINEENDYRLELIKNESDIQSKNIIEFTDNYSIDFDYSFKERNDNYSINRKWLKYIIYKYKSNYYFLKISYKNENTINQLLHILNNNKNICISYISNEGCNKCFINKSEKMFLSAVINYDINYLHTFTIEQLIYFNLKK